MQSQIIALLVPQVAARPPCWCAVATASLRSKESTPAWLPPRGLPQAGFVKVLRSWTRLPQRWSATK